MVATKPRRNASLVFRQAVESRLHPVQLHATRLKTSDALHCGFAFITRLRLQKAVLAPIRINVAQKVRHQRFVEIREVTGERLVTVIEFLSPSNKLSPGRKAYLRKRQQLLKSIVNVVEVDLTRGGDWRSLFRYVGLAIPQPETTYRTLIFRPSMTDRDLQLWLQPMPLREPLPAIKIPLRETDTPVDLPLKPMIDLAYAEGRYGRTLKYGQPSIVPLSAGDQQWMNEQRSPA